MYECDRGNGGKAIYVLISAVDGWSGDKARLVYKEEEYGNDGRDQY